MAELIALIILLVGFLGITGIITKKARVLAELSEINAGSGIKDFILDLKEKVKNSNHLKGFSLAILPHKVLSKIRVLTLKIDNKTSNLLQQLREKTKNKKIEEKVKEEDSFWKEINESKTSELPGELLKEEDNGEDNYWENLKESTKEE